MAADRNAVIAMGQTEFVRRWNMGSAERKSLVALFGFASVASLGNVVNHRPPNGLGWIPGGEPNTVPVPVPTALVNGYWSFQLVATIKAWCELREIETPNIDQRHEVVKFLTAWAQNSAFNRFISERQKDGFSHELKQAGVKTASMLEAEAKAKAALAVSVSQAMLLLEGQGYVVLTGLDELPLTSALDSALEAGDYKSAQGVWLALEAVETKHALASRLMETLDLRAMESVELREGFQSRIDELREKACAVEIENDKPLLPADQAAIDAAELEAFRAWKASQA